MSASASFARTKSARICASGVAPPRSAAAGCSVGISTPCANGYDRPRSFMMPSVVPSSHCAAKRPSVTTDGRTDQVELELQVRTAGIDLVRLGITVAGRAALHDVGDVHRVSPDAQLLPHQLVEELAAAADERQALLVLLRTGTLTDEHERRRIRSRPEHHVGAALAQPAAGADGCLGGDVGERGDGVGHEE